MDVITPPPLLASPSMRHVHSFEHLLERERLASTTKTVFVMVGLPGRGKSFISSKLENFLKWKGQTVKSFNVGSYRRKAMGATETGSSSFYSHDNVDAVKLRNKIAMIALEEMVEWLVKTEGDAVAIFDATNTTNARRDATLEAIMDAPVPIAVVFIESICTDSAVLEANFRNKVKHSPDFVNQDPEAALADLKARISNYERVYETITDDNLSYIKIYNLSAKMLCNKVYGHVSKSVLPALMAWNVSTRPIWLVRCGAPVGANGGSDTHPYSVHRNACLSREGEEFASKLGAFVRSRVAQWLQTHTTRKASSAALCGSFPSLALSAPSSPSKSDTEPPTHESPPESLLQPTTNNTPPPHPSPHSSHLHAGHHGLHGIKVFTSTIPRSEQTAQHGRLTPISQTPTLNPLDKGTMHDMPMQAIQSMHPDWYHQWQLDPLHTRFPGGESYHDVITRLETCVIEMEQQVQPVVVISHVSVLQVLLAYFTRAAPHHVHNIRIPVGSVIEMRPTWRGEWEIECHMLGQGLGVIPGYKE